MADKPGTKLPVEIIPSAQGGISAIASAHAPFLFFEVASVFGHMDGVFRVTLEAARILPSDGPEVGFDRVIVAHLRMSRAGALSLKNAIDGALLLSEPSPTLEHKPN